MFIGLPQDAALCAPARLWKTGAWNFRVSGIL
jgi:hypothetical protein